MTPLLRQAMGPIYPWAMRAKGSRPARVLLAYPGGIPYMAARARDSRRIAIDITSPIGFGAVISHALLLHAFAESAGLTCHVRATSPLYSERGEDILARYFERAPWPRDLAPLRASAREFLIQCIRPAHIPLAEAQRLFFRHFRPSAELRDTIDAAASDVQRFDLAVHFRGTDKFLESGSVDRSAIMALIAAELAGIAAPHIFLATDDTVFATAVRAAFPAARFSSYDLGQVGPGVPRHFSDLAPSDKALEALVNIFLISRAPVCIRTSSYLSSISALANPRQRTVTINRTINKHTPFPEREILDLELIMAAGPTDVVAQ